MAWPFDGFELDLSWQNRVIANHPSLQELEAELQIARNQEHTRFDEGDSDQFLLNARETAAGQAQLEAIAAEVAWLRQKPGLLALGIELLDL